MLVPLTLPRNAHLWLPGYLGDRWARRAASPVNTVWLMIGDHYEPHVGRPGDTVARARVARWVRDWPALASRYRDSVGRAPQYTFFYPEEEYHYDLLKPLADFRDSSIGDVEIHLHHDGEKEADFVARMRGFLETLHDRHGLLRKVDGRLVFGFIHGNWALDNSRPDGRWCGLNNEIQLLRDLGCYADFTLPSAPSPAQTRIVNTIYWATDDPAKPKSHDTGIPVTVPGSTGDLLMIPGPLALNWRERSRGVLPRVEVGELAASNPVTRERVRLWLRAAPQVHGQVFIKLFAHGAREDNAAALLERDLDRTFTYLGEEAQRTGAELRFVTAWEMYQAVKSAAAGLPDVTEQVEHAAQDRA